MQNRIEEIYQDFCQKVDGIISRLENELKSPDQSGDSGQGRCVDGKALHPQHSRKRRICK